MATPLYPRFQKLISDEFEQLIRKQVTPWAFLNSGDPVHLKKFDGSDIHYGGLSFEGSPQTVFWSRYIEPFIEDIVLRSIEAAVDAARKRNVDGAALLAEVQGLFISYSRKVFDRMSRIDRRLRSQGDPKSVPLRSVDREHAEIVRFIDTHVHAELEMWRSSVSSNPPSQSNVITSTQRKLLLALFQQQKDGKSVSARWFRAQNDEHLDEISELASEGWIEDREGQYTVKLVGIGELAGIDGAAKSLIYLCGHVYEYLRKQYKEDPDKKISLIELAVLVDMPLSEIRKALPYLRDALLFSAYTTDLQSPDAYVTLSEELIRHKSFSEILEKHHGWTVNHSEELMASRKTNTNDVSVGAKRNRIVSTPLEEYTLIKQIGQGGAGLVMEAQNESGTRVALKYLSSPNTSESIRTRFRNEIRFGQSIRHKNIVPVIDVGSGDFGQGSSLFFVMPLYGKTLRVAMDREPLSAVNWMRVFADILNGVKEAHRHSVWHRDLKPENILLNDDSSEVRVGDFGIAHYSENELYSAAETKAADRLANFKYAAPEQRDRHAHKDHRVDIFSLGLILNEIFTGVVPHGSDFKRISDCNKQYSRLDELVLKMIRQDPQKRPESIDEVLGELNSYGYLSGGHAASKSNALVVSELTGSPVRTGGVLTDAFKNWIREKRDNEEKRRGTIQSILDAMQEMGPLQGDELNRLSPISSQELEDMGYIEYADGHWIVRKTAVGNLRKVLPVPSSASEIKSEPRVASPISTNVPLPQAVRLLLKEAASDSSGAVMLLNTLDGTKLQVNGKNMIDDQSRRTVATWEAALSELIDRGLLVQKGKNIYQVTAKGFDVAENS